MGVCYGVWIDERSREGSYENGVFEKSFIRKVGWKEVDECRKLDDGRLGVEFDRTKVG